MHVAFDTNELSQLDMQVLAVIVGANPPAPQPAPAPAGTVAAPAPKPAPAKKEAPAAKPEPVVEAEPEPAPEPVAETQPEPEEDLVGAEGPTMADAVAAATKLVSSGEAKKVKEALASVGAARVSNIPADQVAAFLAALDA